MIFIKTLIFFLAMWCSIAHITNILTIIVTKKGKTDGILGYIALVLWSVLYALSQ